MEAVAQRLVEAGINIETPKGQLILARANEMPLYCVSLYVKAMSKGPRSVAIRAFCQMCMGWRKAEVSRCTDPSCPLFRFRRGPQRNEAS